ncbi:SigE family RNA polymerase sigma factor [Nocardioides sp. GXZ039]|uniref:SigE family RNA polymerase sigma factor n=1 Tax=Nocardioides sp. GXZ039 TaxID=3136018 RepID=UPI0030F3C6C1
MRRPRDSRAEFVEFATARSAALHRAAYLMVGDVGLAQDLVQEALTKTYVAWPRLRDPANAEAYTRKAITTTAISWFRRKSWSHERTAAVLPEGSLGDHAGPVSERETLWTALQTLPVRQRTAIVLRYYEDLTEPQTAEAMGCAVGTVKSQVSAGIAKLRVLLRDQLDTELDAVLATGLTGGLTSGLTTERDPAPPPAPATGRTHATCHIDHNDNEAARS